MEIHNEIKIDFDAVYNYFKDGNFEISQNKEIEFENKNELLENRACSPLLLNIH